MGPERYRAYIGELLDRRFIDVKKTFDPDFLINRGTVFVPQERAP